MSNNRIINIATIAYLAFLLESVNLTVSIYSQSSLTQFFYYVRFRN